jgi:hypothetical protein
VVCLGTESGPFFAEGLPCATKGMSLAGSSGSYSSQRLETSTRRHRQHARPQLFVMRCRARPPLPLELGIRASLAPQTPLVVPQTLLGPPLLGRRRRRPSPRNSMCATSKSAVRYGASRISRKGTSLLPRKGVYMSSADLGRCLTEFTTIPSRENPPPPCAITRLT